MVKNRKWKLPFHIFLIISVISGIIMAIITDTPSLLSEFAFTISISAIIFFAFLVSFAKVDKSERIYRSQD